MRAFTRSIKFRIVVAFGICVVLMAAIGIFGMVGFSRLNSNMSAALEHNIMPIVHLSDIGATQASLRAKLRHLQASRSREEASDVAPKIKADLDALDKAWDDYNSVRLANEDGRVIESRLGTSLSEFKSKGQEAMAAVGAGNFDALPDLSSRLTVVADAITNDLGNAAANNVEQAKRFAENGASLFSVIVWVAAAMLCIGVIVATGVSIYLVRAISRPLNKAVEIANRIADGNLDNQIEVVGSQGEFGQLLDALRTMDRQLGDAVRSIKVSTESVTVGAQQIASGNGDLSARTEEQAASLEETASSMAQLTETVNQNAENARQASSLATKATDMADVGNEAVRDMVRSIGEVNGRSETISQIIGTIEGIAFQTNILALNAAVEAARAGEQGRGFAVVASEVRSLAQRSAAAAKEIKELIATSVILIQGSAKQASEAGVTMDQVKHAIKQVSDIVAEIAVASEEQSRGIEQVHQAVSQMDEVTQQNAALVEEAAAAAHSLEEQAVKLEEVVSVFTVRDSDSLVFPPVDMLRKANVPVAKSSRVGAKAKAFA